VLAPTEVLRLRALASPYIVPVSEWFEEADHINIVFDCDQSISLADYITVQNVEGKDIPENVSLARELRLQFVFLSRVSGCGCEIL
jgi:hypothetical protein